MEVVKAAYTGKFETQWLGSAVAREAEATARESAMRAAPLRAEIPERTFRPRVFPNLTEFNVY